MNTVYKRVGLTALTVISAVTAAGCSSVTSTAQWAEPDDLAGVYPEVTESRNQWQKKIGELPVEVHGDLPGLNDQATLAVIHNAVAPYSSAPASDVALSARQRVVLFIGGNRVPVREDFCAINQAVRRLDDDMSGETLRAAICDGPRIVSYAKAKFTPIELDKKNAGVSVAKLESGLVEPLHAQFNILDLDD